MAVFAAATLLTSLLPLIADSPNILKIAVTRGGKVTANGKSTTLEDLDSICRGLAEHKDEVWRYNLPVRLSSKPDYSDAINGRGESVQPR